MSYRLFFFRLIVSNLLTIFYSFITLFLFGVQYCKNACRLRDPFRQTLRLMPPAPLSDPKYGLHKYVKVNGVKLHYVESGDPSKPLMLFLHGFPEFWYSWRYQIVDFQKDYWCVAVDLRGYGDSEKPEGVENYKIELLIEDVRALIQELGAEKCIMIAHDFGGLVACALRDIHPEMLHALVMLGSTSREAWLYQIWADWNQLMRSWYVFMFRMPWIGEHMILINDMRIYNEVMRTRTSEYTNELDIDCYKYWFGKPYALVGPINYYRANFSYCATTTGVHEENVPFLVANGEFDLYLSPSLLETMKKNYTTIETVVLDKVGHFSQQEVPVRVNELIRTFLSKNNL